MATYVQHTSWQLARLADCADPDAHDGIGFEHLPTMTDDNAKPKGSPGAVFLRHIENDVRERFEDPNGYGDGWSEDAVSEIADAAVPVYTHGRWQAFVDLAAYTEDPSELGSTADDMTQAAGVCLYMIAERLACALAEEYAEEDESDVRCKCGHFKEEHGDDGACAGCDASGTSPDGLCLNGGYEEDDDSDA